MKWEHIDGAIVRTPIAGGWLVRANPDDEPWSICFVPDPHWSWQLHLVYCGSPGCFLRKEHMHDKESQS
jgi:hypothetical protein